MSIEVVKQVKAELEARGISLEGPCGAFEITKRVAWALRDKGAGLLYKPSGNNCQEYATDIICYPNADIYDILGDSGGFNTPLFNFAGKIDVERYRPAFDPGDIPMPIPPPNNDINVIAKMLMEHDQRMINGMEFLHNEMNQLNVRMAQFEEMLKAAGHQIDAGLHKIYDAIVNPPIK